MPQRDSPTAPWQAAQACKVKLSLDFWCRWEALFWFNYPTDSRNPASFSRIPPKQTYEMRWASSNVLLLPMVLTFSPQETLTYLLLWQILGMQTNPYTTVLSPSLPPSQQPASPSLPFGFGEQSPIHHIYICPLQLQGIHNQLDGAVGFHWRPCHDAWDKGLAPVGLSTPATCSKNPSSSLPLSSHFLTSRSLIWVRGQKQ